MYFPPRNKPFNLSISDSPKFKPQIRTVIGCNITLPCLYILVFTDDL